MDILELVQSMKKSIGYGSCRNITISKEQYENLEMTFDEENERLFKRASDGTFTIFPGSSEIID